MKNQDSSIKLCQFTRADVNYQRRLLFKQFFQLDEYHLSHRLFDGSWSKPIVREVFERGDAVVLIPYDPVADTLVFQEQFRPGALRTQETPWLLEFVAGMFGENESPQEVACREAKEEANLDVEAKSLVHVMNYLSSPGGTTEYIHLYAAPVDSVGVGGIYGLEEEGEDIKVLVVSRTEALELLDAGKICNAATIIGVQWLAQNYKHLQKRWLNGDRE